MNGIELSLARSLSLTRLAGLEGGSELVVLCVVGPALAQSPSCPSARPAKRQPRPGRATAAAAETLELVRVRSLTTGQRRLGAGTLLCLPSDHTQTSHPQLWSNNSQEKGLFGETAKSGCQIYWRELRS